MEQTDKYLKGVCATCGDGWEWTAGVFPTSQSRQLTRGCSDRISKQRPEGRGGTNQASRGWEEVKLEHCDLERKPRARARVQWPGIRHI